MLNDNGWIQTLSGGRFYPLTPDAKDVNIKDIAGALSKNCRFTGHCSKFYSVAEHSVLVYDIMREKTRDPEILMWALLHDASEAYLSDIARPLKHQPEFEFYRVVEKNVMRVVATRFGMEPEEPASVKWADNCALRLEAQHLMPQREKAKWSWLDQYGCINKGYSMGWSPGHAEETFMLIYNLLESQRV